jgi:hypothetical protein
MLARKSSLRIHSEMFGDKAPGIRHLERTPVTLSPCAEFPLSEAKDDSPNPSSVRFRGSSGDFQF